MISDGWLAPAEPAALGSGQADVHLLSESVHGIGRADHDLQVRDLVVTQRDQVHTLERQVTNVGRELKGPVGLVDPLAVLLEVLEGLHCGGKNQHGYGFTVSGLPIGWRPERDVVSKQVVEVDDVAIGYELVPGGEGIGDEISLRPDRWPQR